MKKFMITILTLVPLTIWAQDNTWERPDVEEEKEVKQNQVVAKYLRGAVPLVDGKVVFSKTIDAPGKSASEVFGIVRGYLEKMTREKNQEDSHIVIDDSEKHQVAGSYEEWLVFKSSAIYLDQTRFYYVLLAKCFDGKAEVTMSRLRYLYDEYRKPQNIRAEDCITDDEAVNKKNTRLYPNTGKFRRKTIDRKNFIFNKLETLLK